VSNVPADDKTARVQRATTHVAALDGIRGIAILAVTAFHFVWQASERVPAGGAGQHLLMRLADLGTNGVDLFFRPFGVSHRVPARHEVVSPLLSRLLRAADASHLSGVLRVSRRGADRRSRPVPAEFIGARRRKGPGVGVALRHEFQDCAREPVGVLRNGRVWPGHRAQSHVVTGGRGALLPRVASRRLAVLTAHALAHVRRAHSRRPRLPVAAPGPLVCDVRAHSLPDGRPRIGGFPRDGNPRARPCLATTLRRGARGSRGRDLRRHRRSSGRSSCAPTRRTSPFVHVDRHPQRGAHRHRTHVVGRPVAPRPRCPRTRKPRTSLGKYSYGLYLFHSALRPVLVWLFPPDRLASRLGSPALAVVSSPPVHPFCSRSVAIMPSKSAFCA